MRTELLHLAHAKLLAFEARVLAQEPVAQRDRVALVLDRTGFYPESGGQLADHGTLGGVPVLDVQLDEAGRALHVVDATGPLPAVSTLVHGHIEPQRRRVHMALHTAQHMLSRALVDVAHAETVSSRLGEQDCTIDVDREGLSDRTLAKAEELVNAVVTDDVPVRAFFPSSPELAALPLRRAPKVTDNVRVVEIEGFDVSPCGGTHCTSTAQVGFLRLTGEERYKGKLRIHFSAGPRARLEAAHENALLRGLATSFTCGIDDVPAAVESLRRELGLARDELKTHRSKLADALAAQWLARAEATGAPIVELVDTGGRELARLLAKRLAHGAHAVVLAAPESDGFSLVIARGPGSTLDAGATMKRFAAELSGRGGGRSESAEGKVKLGDPTTTLDALRKLLAEELER